MVVEARISRRDYADFIDFRIPYPTVDPVAEAAFFYTEYYRTEDDDSPPRSRESLIDRMRLYTQQLPAGSRVLDLGAGRQILESEYVRKFGPPHFTVDTVDIAAIDPQNLFAQSVPNIHHHTASGNKLPFSDATFDVVISNMAFDFMPDDAMEEMMRVAKPGAPIVMNLHHPSKIPPRVEELREELQHKINRKTRRGDKKGLETRRMQLAKYDHDIYMKKNNKLYGTEQIIQMVFETSGFKVKRIEKAQDEFRYEWWEVDIMKPLPQIHDKQSGTTKQKKGLGESRFGQGTRQWIVTTEEEITQRRQGIKAIEQERRDTTGYFQSGLLSDTEYVVFDSALLEKRKSISSEQSQARKEIRPYKTKPVE